MLIMNELAADAATALDLGQRQRQEDAVVTDFSQGAEMGIAVLSDGMGGHSAGDVASRIIVTEIFGELFFCSARTDQLREHAVSILRSAVAAANQSLRAHAEAKSGREGMGGTVLASVIMDDELRWISVGDSPLYLFRDGELTRLNEDHSMAPQIDHMAREGIIDETLARNHPQRSCLTSALTGGDIGKIDCPERSLGLRPGDIVLMASDGLQVLENTTIERILYSNRHRPSEKITATLMAAIKAVEAPHQDNVSLAVIRFSAGTSAGSPSRAGLRDMFANVLDSGRRVWASVRQMPGQAKGRTTL
ncbi:MAG: PP2C family protein-serine/threonine phosphatase [Marinibacterium sp.]